MPKARAEVSDTDEEMEEVPKNKKQPKSKPQDESEEDELQEHEDGQQNGEEESEPEYEIEKIEKHERVNGAMGYWVKWKGYPSSDNTWVPEADATNASALIDEYWKRSKKEHKAAPKSRHTPASKGRKSAPVREESSEVESVPQPKKRGRPPKVKSPETSEDEEEEPKAKKVRRKSSTGASTAKTTRKSKPEPEEDDEDEGESFVDMKSWKDAATWEHIVDTIDTVERTEDGNLFVYFTLNRTGTGKVKGGAKCREESSVCKDKFPRKLLEFYETNLRWRKTDENDE